jgi:Protein of unknown function (DUF3592)
VPDLPWYVYAMLLAPLVLVLFAAAYKTLQVRAAREWPSAPGQVVISDSEVREIRVLDDSREDNYRLEQRNFANIVYQYSVAGKQPRNNRVGIGEDRGNFEIAETIAKYPVGTSVTVFYNPLHPNEAVLERDLPKGLWGCLGIGTAIVLAIVFGGVFGLNRLTGFVATLLANPRVSPIVVVFGVFGLVIALCARYAAAVAAREALAGGAGDHQDVRCPAIPQRADQRRYAGGSHVSAAGVVRLQLQQRCLHLHRGQPCHRRQFDVGLADAQIHHGVSGRRQRECLRQSGQSVGSDAQSARRCLHHLDSGAARRRVLGIGVFRRDAGLERFRARWIPVRVKKTRQNKKSRTSVLIQSEPKL